MASPSTCSVYLLWYPAGHGLDPGLADVPVRPPLQYSWHRQHRLRSHTIELRHYPSGLPIADSCTHCPRAFKLSGSTVLLRAYSSNPEEGFTFAMEEFMLAKARKGPVTKMFRLHRLRSTNRDCDRYGSRGSWT